MKIKRPEKDLRGPSVDVIIVDELEPVSEVKSPYIMGCDFAKPPGAFTVVKSAAVGPTEMMLAGMSSIDLDEALERGHLGGGEQEVRADADDQG